MHLPSFLWLWKIAAWSMGLSLAAYVFLGVSGVWMWRGRRTRERERIGIVRSLHLIMGITMASLVLLLSGIGIVGTLGHFGNLGHSPHLAAGIITVILVLASVFSALQISTGKPWARPVHITINVILFAGFAWVSLTGWTVVQKYLP
ncbi:MAG TPA: DUF4079 domain-containing protein [Nostocaceae cyanobacterium]|nr:DUF4079 domain-containing protein [Nostocaceae cyanobacterium]